jgi:hypothetical protein
MGNLKMLKAPKKPKASASAATMKKYLERVDAIAAENARRVKENNERESLYKNTGIKRCANEAHHRKAQKFFAQRHQKKKRRKT